MMTHRLLVACLLALWVTWSAAQETRIGYIDTRRIENESALSVRALEAMKKEFTPREQQIIEFQKQITADKERFDKERDKLPQAELQSRANALTGMMRKSDQMTLALSEDIERRRREILGKLSSEARAAVKAVAEAGKFDLVLEQATYIRPGMDITDQVLKEMAKRSGAAK
ncbi:MAG TPA: OmpH family outer membrane protein [Burkholderiales bacterium]|jgi:outer membrane protein|nr:OmpH family outer membrane protein [Burkholderiales bacterium]